MLQTIIDAAKNFCTDQLGKTDIEVIQKPQIPQEGLVTSIEITEPAEKHFKVYLTAEKEFVQNVAEIFLEEKESDDETIRDIALECTNLIVGSAKVIAAQNGLDFTISTPVLETKKVSSETFEESAALICDGNALIIAIEPLKG